MALLVVHFSFKSADLNASNVTTDIEFEDVTRDKILIIAGDGGPSGSLFSKAVATYQRDNGGVAYEVKSGDEFISAVKDFVDQYGEIDHLVFFGHGNNVGLYVNQQPNVNGGLYANDPDLDKDYVAASIYELPADIFSEKGWIKFNGCNVAEGYPDKPNLGQSFANYFNVDVVASRGPTEFSTNPYGVDPLPQANYLPPDFDGDVYMVSTYPERDFIVVRPQEPSDSGFIDVHKGTSYDEAVYQLKKRGLDLDFTDAKFLPYKNVTWKEAALFCKAAVGDASKCSIGPNQPLWLIRNLKALKLLTDAFSIELKSTNPWYDSYIWWAKNENLLTADFTNKKWYTRAEMAELTWNFIQRLEE